MKKILFLFSLLSLVTLTQIQAQSSIYKKICPISTCCASAANDDATATTTTTTSEAKAVQVGLKTSEQKSPCCPEFLQQVCSTLGLSCATTGGTAKGTKLAVNDQKMNCKPAACNKAKEQTAALLPEEL